ncbi:MAG: hypothetical protein Ct9H300mP21_05190 [Pseudomonadota bacterium]|nr:MAG: hypothetical protein Ct9H300mP21_05190 [Pseudomonadota bacterium]
MKDYVQREFNFAVVDEVDSILIDEARTPLIISGPTEDNIDKYHQINKFVYGLSREIRKEEVGKLPQDQMHNIAKIWKNWKTTILCVMEIMRSMRGPAVST